jgi:hypothetical protein
MQFTKQEQSQNHFKLVSNLSSPFWDSSFQTPISFHYSTTLKPYSQTVICIPFPERSKLSKTQFETIVFSLCPAHHSSSTHYLKYPYPLMKENNIEYVYLYANMKIECLPRQKGGGIKFQSLLSPLNFFF